MNHAYTPRHANVRLGKARSAARPCVYIRGYTSKQPWSSRDELLRGFFSNIADARGKQTRHRAPGGSYGEQRGSLCGRFSAHIIEMLKTRYRVQEVIDYSCLEVDGLYLEGTGAMVLDHINRVAYTAHQTAPTQSPWSGFAPISVSSRWLLTAPIQRVSRSITPM